MKHATISLYAKLAGVSKQAIHDRISRGTLSTTTKEDLSGRTVTVIDLKKFPPKRGKSGRPKSKLP